MLTEQLFLWTRGKNMVGLLIFAALLALGLFVGGYIERKHFADLDQREEATQNMLVTQIKTYPAVSFEKQPTFLCSEVVISSDYLKTFLSGIRKFFGGELKSFRTILERARREALVRLKEDASSQGYDAICNVRLETAAIAGKGAGSKNKVMMASIIATGTAYTSNRSPGLNHLA